MKPKRQLPDLFAMPEPPPIAGAADQSIISEAAIAISRIAQLSLADQVETINELRALIHETSPFRSEPVDLVRWVRNETVAANDYNPNAVASPEMELLRLSIMQDGYTQPIVSNKENSLLIVVDGFHRNRVGKECDDVRERVKGYLPVVQIRATQSEVPDRMASTIRHNRARGKHRVEGMTDIVLELKRRNWSDEKIGKQLGMDPDEILRLVQISGLIDAFKDREFSEAWEPSRVDIEPSSDLPDEDADDIGGETAVFE